MQNFSLVRHRLRKQLNVQLTDSNIVQDRLLNKLQSSSRIIYNPNESQSCDISLIDDLRLFDQLQKKVDSHNLQGNSNCNMQSMINDDYKSYHKHQIIDQKDKNISSNKNYDHDDISLILSKKLSPTSKNISNRINSLYDHNQFQQQHNFQQRQLQPPSTIKISHIFKPTVIKQKQSITRLKRLNSQNDGGIIKILSSSNLNTKLNSQNKNQHFQVNNNNNNSDIADIQQKLSILPLELQQKIKRKLHKKRSFLQLQQRQQKQQDFLPQKKNAILNSDRNIINYEQSYIQHNFNQQENNSTSKAIYNQPIANEAVSFILPIKGDEEQYKKINGMKDQNNSSNNFRHRSKFVSVNRQASNNNLSSSTNKKSLILLRENSNSNRYEFKTKNKNQYVLLNEYSNKRKTQKSLSREKNLLLNSVSPSNGKSPSPSLRIINNSREKYQQSSSSIFNKNSTNQLIQRRRQQFAEFFKQKQQKNISQNHNQHQQNVSKQNQINRINSNNIIESNQFNQKDESSNLLRQNHIELQQLFNKSKVIRNYIEILSTVPKCKKCSTTFGALTLTNNHSVTFSCNQCDLKNKLQRSVSFLSSSDYKSSQNDLLCLQKNSSQFNHPVIGVLFDLQNKLENQQQMKTYNSLLKQINMEIQKIDQKRKRLTTLLNQIQELKSKIQKNPKVIFEAKNELKKFLINNESQESKDLQSCLNIPMPTFLPSQYLQQMDLWCKINSNKFTQYPQIDSKLQILCPLYMKRYMKTMGQFINPLFHNFETKNVKISVSQGLKLPVKSLGKATFVIDGPYNISPFEQIQNLTLQFLNKRTFRQIASVMECLPQKVQSIQLIYNHKFNSHISAQKYPILTKVVSLRSCKKLNAQILNCKDEDDLLSAFRVMTKKRQLKLQTTRSIYVRKPITNCTQQIKDMLKRLGKNICQIDLKMAAYFNESVIYKQLMVTERNKLIGFRLQSTVGENDSPTKLQNDRQKFIKRDNLLNNFPIEDLNKKRSQQNFAKKCFLNKIRKKITAFVVLKKSFVEMEAFLSFNQTMNEKSAKKVEMQKDYKSNHLLRLQVLKMLI